MTSARLIHSQRLRCAGTFGASAWKLEGDQPKPQGFACCQFYCEKLHYSRTEKQELLHSSLRLRLLRLLDGLLPRRHVRHVPLVRVVRGLHRHFVNLRKDLLLRLGK